MDRSRLKQLQGGSPDEEGSDLYDEAKMVKESRSEVKQEIINSLIVIHDACLNVSHCLELRAG
jgi:delta-aminolevulinic acid dehydratase/porphobilinogen synthase